MGWMPKLAAAIAMAVTILAGSPDVAGAKPERPTYAVVSSEKEFEIRDYDRMVLAQFSMNGSYRRAVSQGYLRLERYFMGENSTPEPIKMTVPAMVRDDLSGGWTTMFYLGAAYRPETAPLPNDNRIRLIELPPRRVAVISFSGDLDENIMRQKKAELKAWLDAHGMAYKGDFTLAGYVTAGFAGAWVKNEVLVTLR